MADVDIGGGLFTIFKLQFANGDSARCFKFTNFLLRGAVACSRKIRLVSRNQLELLITH